MKSNLTLKTRVKGWAEADRSLGVFAVTLIVWKHFYSMLKFQNRFLEDAGKASTELASESSFENCCRHPHRNSALCPHRTAGAAHCSLWLKSYLIIYLKVMTRRSHIAKQGAHTGFFLGGIETIFLPYNNLNIVQHIFSTVDVYVVRQPTRGQCATEAVLQSSQEWDNFWLELVKLGDRNSWKININAISVHFNLI